MPGTGDPDWLRSSGAPGGTAKLTKVPARSGVQVASEAPPLSPREASIPASGRDDPAAPLDPAAPPDPDLPPSPPAPESPAPDPAVAPEPPEPALPPLAPPPDAPLAPPRAALPAPPPAGLPVDPAPPWPAPPLSSTVSPPAHCKRAKPIRIAAPSMRTSDCMRSGGDREKWGRSQAFLVSPMHERAVRADFFQEARALKAIVYGAHPAKARAAAFRVLQRGRFAA
jgi:hypothetical protein